jgi:hypothetical protein
MQNEPGDIGHRAGLEYNKLKNGVKVILKYIILVPKIPNSHYLSNHSSLIE